MTTPASLNDDGDCDHPQSKLSSVMTTQFVSHHIVFACSHIHLLRQVGGISATLTSAINNHLSSV